jgi:hypothetical protein
MNVVCTYVYIHYHLNECQRKKSALERTIFWNIRSIFFYLTASLFKIVDGPICF